MTVLIRNAHVLSFDDQGRAWPRADILTDGARIVAVGPDLAPPRDRPVEQIDAAGMLAIPGLINAHLHSPATLGKGALAPMPLEVFMLHEVPPLAAAPPPPRTVYVRTLLGAVEMLKTGVTAVQDDAFFTPAPDVAAIDALMQAYADAGIRATVALDQPNVVEFEKYPFLRDLLPEAVLRRMAAAPRLSTAELLALYRHLIDRWHGACGGRLRAAVSCSAPQRVTEDYMAALSGLSRDLDIPFFVHMLETRVQRVLGQERWGRSLVHRLHDLGALDARVNLIHGIWIDDTDMDLIAATGAVIAHNPVCNLRLGSGVMPFRRIRDRGIPVCLGTDEALADDSLNLWGAIKMAGLVHTLADADYRTWPDAAEVLDCVFRGGARAMRLADETGCIAPGRRADIALIDLDTLPFTPLNDLRRQLVYCETGASVRLTMVDGAVVMRDGQVRGVDEAALRREARELGRIEAEARRADSAEAAALEPYYRAMVLRAAETDVGMNRRGAGPDRAGG
jgi:cytosine/adenosine deaminase-related metal-dependent hydrolase